MRKLKVFSVSVILLLLTAQYAYGQPANDNCTNASIVNISSGGFGLGIFTSSTFDLTSATVQPGETFAPAILVAGQNQKSTWYKFSLPTTRSVRVTLAQPGALITAGDAGFAVYKTNTCIPTGAEISTKLTPIGIFGNTFHPCVESGDYFVQVSGKAAANGPVYITVETGLSVAAHDQPVQAYNFGTLFRGTSPTNFFNIDCQSIEDGSEICNTLGNYQDYNKSTWHVFKTPAYLDYLAILLYTNSDTKVGYKVYEGDVRSSVYSSLPVVLACDSTVNLAQQHSRKFFDCNVLKPNTTYSLELFFRKDYQGPNQLSIAVGGFAPTIAPEPILSAITPTTNTLGVLPSNPAGTLIQRNDYLSCNARHSLHPCNPSLPTAGVSYGGNTYNLSSFFTFTLSGTSNINFDISNSNPVGSCGPDLLVRLYKQNVSNSCGSLDTTNIIRSFIRSSYFSCLPAGDYTFQVMGQDLYNPNAFACFKTNLGTIFDMNLTVQSVNATNKFNLSSPGAFDTLNKVSGVMQPMVPGVTYTSKADTFGCANTVMPLDAADINCVPGKTKAIYREFIVPDSGIVSMWSGVGPPTGLNYKLYKGDANALAIAQNAFAYPATISGLTPVTLCLNNTLAPPYVCDFEKVCLVPGTYTEVVFGDNNQISVPNQFKARFDIVNTTHYDLAHAEDLGDILSVIPASGGSITSTADYYSCKDNAIVIDGFQPCKGGYGSPGTKAIYRQFYLSSAASVTINSLAFGCDVTPLTLFKGKATDGIAALKVMPAPWRCFISNGLSICDVLPSGWYTIVSYGYGPTYQNPMRDLKDVTGGYVQYGSMVGYGNKISISVAVSPCAPPKYNRPYKASIDTITNQPFLIKWGPRVGHTAAYPKTDTTYTLYTENFNCTNDTPFAAHPLVGCNAVSTKVAYWVFRITQESFVSINTENYWNGVPYAYSAKVYAGNARTDSALFGTAQPIQPCLMSLGHLQLCKLQPGDYTLIVFATPDALCRQITPTIYIDQVGYSRFDHANNAYDFGLVPPDSTWRNGKPGDINPLNPARAASNDFFYCTTGAQITDPTYGCASVVLPNIYNPGNNIPLFTSNYINGDGYTYPLGVARNLWYTFTVDKGGLVKVRVNNKTIGRGWQYNYLVLKSNVDGSLPFSTVVASGGVDSTMVQGLEIVASNSRLYCDATDEVSFFRETCTPIPERYYIIVANRVPSNYDQHTFFNPEWMYPNHQVEVSVLFDSVNAIQPQFDHYYQANNIGTNLGPGIYTGATDNFSCATRDATDPAWNPNTEPSICGKTLWYKFSTTVSGVIKPWVVINGAARISNYDIQLYRQIIPGDSTANGLQIMDFYNGNWECCITPGTYYILLPNCNLTGGIEFPQIQLIENAGDFCSRPVIATLNGAGTSITSALVNCHTIGTDYGEFNPTLTCPAGAITSQYKTSWFKINITGTDTLDVTTYLSNSTSVPSTQIKYRLMNGDCSAMQERSCVQDAQTQDTYKCLAPGNYWVQVFTPFHTTGTINLNLSAVHHADTCAPINSCLSNANFQKQFDCTQSTAVRFINYSTYGSSVSYQWNFGYNSQISTAVSPQFVYPSLTTSQKYYITLTVTNNTCGGFSTYMDSITIPARPVVNLGADISLCNGGTVILDATSFPGATYQWSTGASTPTITVSAPGQNNYVVAVTYNGCIARDTIRVNIDPIIPQTQYKSICGLNAAQLNSSRGLGESYNWSTGATTSSINVFLPGTYWIDMNLNGCITRDSFIVSSAVYSLGPDKQVCFSQPVILNATTQGATGYVWQNGSTAATFNATSPGLYWVDVVFGNCTLRDTVVLSNIQAALATLSASICQGQNFTLTSGAIINTAGIYKDTLRTTQGCDSLINTVNLTVQSVTSVNLAAAICAGQTYTLPWGTVVNTTGIYKDTLHYVSGCDSIRRTVNLIIQQASSSIINAGICAGQTYTLPWGTVVSTAGIYKDTLHYNVTGCDSLYRMINLTIQAAQSQNINAVICSGQAYTLPWGMIVNVTGIYKDTLRYIAGCDSLYRTVDLTTQTTQSYLTKDTICAGQAYTLPWGATVNTTGIYKDTLRYNVTACDSVYRIVDLTVQSSAVTLSSGATICSGQTYTLPWGQIASVTGTYSDTIRFNSSGCDSLYRVVTLTVQPLQILSINPLICSGQTYTLPWGTVVNTTGIYKDSLHYATGCDSLYRIINLTVQSPIVSILNSTICSGQSYTLPWGTVVNTSGIYKDTLHYNSSGCDSIYSTVNLTVQSSQLFMTKDTICSGQIYTLPWGTIATNTGIYKDTLRYSSGCDSIYRIIDLTVQSSAVTSITNATICSGQTYTLPWGAVVSTTGAYTDTLRHVSGCDSVYKTINLTVQTPTSSILNPAICTGQTYTLPWGGIVNTTGFYRDTLRYTTGCDSLFRIVDLTVQSPASQILNPVICSGQTYTLPWGTNVSTAGTYKDTLFYASGCDSLHRTVNLIVQSSTSSSSDITICFGQTYTLPWGVVVSTAGTYRDTLRYLSGCDSVYKTINLTVQSSTSVILNPKICLGQTYTLPWGTVVSTAGVYKDTLHYTTGCDSLYKTVNLIVQSPTSLTLNPKICSGQVYTLPWGVVVSSAGVYKDTLHYTTGCDSLYSTINLTVQTAQTSPAINAVICTGQTYTLPWGAVVSNSGIYLDTLRYSITGCDSIKRSVNLLVQAASTSASNITICQGQSYTLPWGVVVNRAGIYKDTLRYKTTNCDSLFRIVNLTVTPAAISSLNASICSGDVYTLPWGTNVSTAGIYRDTTRTSFGCDSLIKSVTLTVKPQPSISLTKSNDIDCMIGISKLNATGGVQYVWSPAGSLSNSTISNPVATPTATSVYTVRITAGNGCTVQDSIKVIVNKTGIENGFLLPDAFTPNGDGKNDCFGVRAWGNVTNLRFDIYNRWGEIVFRTSDPSQCWDGMYKGEKQSTAVFIYQVWANTFCGPVYRKGTITLIR